MVHIYIYIALKENPESVCLSCSSGTHYRHQKQPCKLSNVDNMPTPYSIKFVSPLYSFGVLNYEMFSVFMKV